LLIIQSAHADGLICYGPRIGNLQYLVLIDDWIPVSRELTSDEALARIALQYFTGHGPATLQDFGWWTGLRMSEAASRLKMVQDELQQLVVNNKVHWMASRTAPCDDGHGLWLLPNYDEYTVGYRDREAIIRPDFRIRKDWSRGDVTLSNVIVLDGEVVGTWKRVTDDNSMRTHARTFRELDQNENELLAKGMDRFISFMKGISDQHLR
jgi:hypothetical protein